jgi:4-carboxymuconolactone decarboxylase
MFSNNMMNTVLSIEAVQFQELTHGLIDAKTAQLILLAIGLNDQEVNLLAQGIAARSAGASWDELRGVVHLMFLLRGLPGSQAGEEFLRSLFEHESRDKLASAMASYG